VLENQDFAETFLAGQVQAPYLTRTLPSMGALVPGYWGTGHSSLDNYIAMVGGQGPNVDTQDDCNDPSTMGDAAHPSFAMDARGQAIGKGCMYPPQVKSIADQLDERGLTWKGYMEDMDLDPSHRRATCQAPGSSPLPGPDTPSPPHNDYKTKHNPFVYFHSTTDRQAYCDARDVPLGQLTHDLASEATTPNFAFIVPNQCNDGHDDQPNCSDGSMGGLMPVDLWVQAWVPKILDSPAFKDDGLLIILWDEADTDGTSCCNEPKGANLGPNETNSKYGPVDSPLTNGGGQTGAIFLSRWITPGTLSTEDYNHYSYLRSVEDLLGVDSGGTDGKGHLGYAAQDGLRTFGSDIFTAFDGTFTPPAGGGGGGGAGGGGPQGGGGEPSGPQGGGAFDSAPTPAPQVLGASGASPPQPAGAIGNCVDVPLRVGIRPPRGERVVRASTTVNGAVVAHRRGRRLDHVLIPRPQGDATVVTIATTSAGTRIRSVRSFRGCRLGPARTTLRHRPTSRSSVR
jgi:phosphatidylinositol-3-phosphatase